MPEFMREYIGADDCLGASDLSPRSRGDQTGDALQALEIDVGAAMRDMAERDGDLLQRGIAGALAETQHGDGCMGRAAADSGERIGGGEADIVMAVEFDRQIGLLAHSTDRFMGRERVERPERIGEAKARRPRRRGRAGDPSYVARIGP